MATDQSTNVRFGVNKETDRPVRVRKLYISPEAPEGLVRASADSLISVARLLFVENGYKIDLDLDALSVEYPKWYRAAAAFGALTAAANAATSAKNLESGGRGELSDMIDAAKARVAEFQVGQWSESAAGPGFADLVGAYVQSRATNGIAVPETTIAALRDKLANKVLTPKALLADLTVAAAYAEIKVRKAQEHAAKAGEEAEGADASADLDEAILV